MGDNLFEILVAKGKGSGLGFAVARKHKDKIKAFKVFSERVASVTLREEEKKGNKTLTIINVHAPTLASTRKNSEVSRALYQMVQTARDSHTAKHEDVIVVGDWNAKLGTGLSRIKRRFSMGTKKN